MIDCIIQARTGSTRFPNKIFNKITNTKSVLEFLIDQLKNSKLINQIIIATTDLTSDDVIVDFCKNHDLKYFRGSNTNVLERYFECAKLFNSKNILRVTSDCPLIDPQLIDQGIEKFLHEPCDYLSNSITPTFPHGLDFQIFTLNTLRIAFENANLESEREHVIPYIINNSKKFKIYDMQNPKNFSNFRITIDWKDDLELVKEIVKHISDRPITMHQIITTLEKYPELIKINSKHFRNTDHLK